MSLLVMPNEDSLLPEILEIKKDVRELMDLVRILSGLVEMPASGSEREKIGIEFEDRLAAMLDRHPKPQHLAKSMSAIEGEVYQLPPVARKKN